jgi:hypothetical protein
MKTLTCMVLIVVALASGATRAQFVETMVDLYEAQTGDYSVVASSPFTDTDDALHNTVAKAHSLKITAGTTSTTFSPNDKLQLYQAFLMAGRTLEAIVNYNAK